MMEAKIKILRKGDKILSIFSHQKSIGISIQRKSGNVEVILVREDEHGSLEISGKLTICEGESVIETKIGEATVEKF